MNRCIQKLIQEQFNIGNMDLTNNKPKRNMSIFNKEYIHPYYYNVLDGTATKNEINELNSFGGLVTIKNKDELKKIIDFYSEKYPKDSLNWLDVSRITDMSHLFKHSLYNGDISKWDVSNVTNMNYMFYDAFYFNQPIGKWDVSNVTDMSGMFYCAYDFNQPIGKWDVSNVTDMSFMFCQAYEFNKPIRNWKVNKVTNMTYMFHCAKEFNQPIGDWDVQNVTDMTYMFNFATNFNQNISKWDINDNIIANKIFYKCPIKEEYKPKKFR